MPKATPTGSNPGLPEKPDWRIFGLKAHNFLRLEAVDMNFDKDGSVVTIGGENGAGKSSALAAIEMILTGPDRKATKITHEGADAYLVELEFGSETVRYIAQRQGTPKSNGPLKISRADDDSSIDTPTSFLKTVLAATFIDPFEWRDMQPKDQRSTLIDMVRLDTSEIDGEIQATREREKQLDIQFTMVRGKVDGLKFHEDAPKERPTTGGLAEELANARAENDTIRDAASRATDRREFAKTCDAEIAALHERIKKAEADKANALSAAEEYDLQANKPMVDVAAIQAKIDGIEEAQRKYDENQTVVKARAEVKASEAERTACVESLKQLQEQKKAMLAAVEFPVPGLGFDEAQVTWNNLPFHQASAAEQIRVSIEIALAKQGRLAPILIRDGSILDDKTLAMIAAIAKEKGAQVFVETVANKKEDGSYDRECSFLIEDGKVVK